MIRIEPNSAEKRKCSISVAVFLLALILILSASLSLVGASSQEIEWDFREVFYRNINSIATNGNIYVAVGEHISLTSDDGITWAAHYIPIRRANGLTWGNGLFVAVGRFGVIYTSTDGVEWTEQDSKVPSNIELYAVAWNGSNFVALGQNGYRTTSADGQTWDVVNTPFNIRDIIWTGDQFVAVGLMSQVLTSFDGTGWFPRSPEGDEHLYASAVGEYGTDTILVVAGDNGTVYTSANNGLDWYEPDTGIEEDLKGLAYNGSTFVAVGTNGAIFTADDGETWTAQDSGTEKDIYSVMWDGSKFLASGSGGLTLTSEDGNTWTVRTEEITNRGGYYSVAWNDDYTLCVAVGSGENIVTSTDGFNWTKEGGTGDTYNLRKVTWGDGQFVAIGAEGTIYTSPDGSEWNRRAHEPSGDIDYDGITWGNDMYVVVGADFSGYSDGGNADAIIITSTDGISWEEKERVEHHECGLFDVTWSGSQFMAVGFEYGGSTNKGIILTSSDGIDWIKQPLLEGEHSYSFNGVAWGSDIFVISSGLNRMLLSSSDGSTWTERLISDHRINDVAWGGGYFVAVGEIGSIYTSSDGLTWTGASYFNAAFQDVTWGGDQFIAVGGLGAIIGSSQIITTTPEDPADPEESTDPETPITSEEPTESVTEDETVSEQVENPETGDHTSVLLRWFMMYISFFSVIVITLVRKKKSARDFSSIRANR